jgi:hypothetical protein
MCTHCGDGTRAVGVDLGIGVNVGVGFGLEVVERPGFALGVAVTGAVEASVGGGIGVVSRVSVGVVVGEGSAAAMACPGGEGKASSEASIMPSNGSAKSRALRQTGSGGGDPDRPMLIAVLLGLPATQDILRTPRHDNSSRCFLPPRVVESIPL